MHGNRKVDDIVWTVQQWADNWWRVTTFIERKWSPGSDELAVIEVPEGKLLTYFDVSQAEPRMMAYMSKDKNFMADYDAGRDVRYKRP